MKNVKSEFVMNLYLIIVVGFHLICLFSKNGEPKIPQSKSQYNRYV